MNARTKPLRGDVGLAEATRDPIFLFQRRRLHWRSEDSFPTGYSHGDDGCLFRDENIHEDVDFKEGDPEYPEYWSPKAWLDAHPYNDEHALIIEWETESVWFTREAAEAWGNSHDYRFEEGWRVYCVNAEGELAAILKDHSLKPTGTVEV